MIKTGKTSESPSLSTQSFYSTDLYPAFQPLFTPEAITVLNNKTYNTVHQYNLQIGRFDFSTLEPLLSNLKIKSAYGIGGNFVRKFALTNYFGYTTTEDKLAAATVDLIGKINDMASNKHIIATMTPLSVIELANAAPPHKRFVVVSYLAIDQAHQAIVESTYPTFKEGTMPLEFI